MLVSSSWWQCCTDLEVIRQVLSKYRILSATLLWSMFLFLCKIFPHHQNFVYIGVSISYHLQIWCVLTSAMAYLFPQAPEMYIITPVRTNNAQRWLRQYTNASCSKLTAAYFQIFKNYAYKMGMDITAYITINPNNIEIVIIIFVIFVKYAEQ